MIALTRAIRAQFAAYGARLSREIARDVIARQLAAIEEAHAAALSSARAVRGEAETALAREPAGTPRHQAAAARAERARAEEARHEEERDRALARARGEVLEAGIFVSYGPAPLAIVIDDEVFGRNRVAIAEKINESARGTARAPAARLRADAALPRERVRRGAPSLQHAWSVFIGQPLSIAIPPDAEDAAMRSLGAGDAQAALRAVAAPVRDALEMAAREPAERAGDIYNCGAAVSEDALVGFLQEVEAKRIVRRVELAPERIPERLRARWFYDVGPQSLVVLFHPDGRLAETFRKVGAAAFKGLGGVVVWELCAEDGGPGALAQALGPVWFRGAAP
jgi:hypothetical protein